MRNKISKKILREFGILIGFTFPILIGWILPAISGHIFRYWSLWVGVPALILGISKPSLLLYPYQAWMKIGLALGWINSHIVLGLVFLLVLQPISLIMKLFGYDPLKKKKRPPNMSLIRACFLVIVCRCPLFLVRILFLAQLAWVIRLHVFNGQFSQLKQLIRKKIVKTYQKIDAGCAQM